MTRLERASMADRAVNDHTGIAGTNWDRRRKLTNKQIGALKKCAQGPNFNVNAAAERLGVTPNTIRYHIDEDYKVEVNSKRAQYAHNSKQSSSYKRELADYKRYLIMTGKKVIYNL